MIQIGDKVKLAGDINSITVGAMEIDGEIEVTEDNIVILKNLEREEEIEVIKDDYFTDKSVENESEEVEENE